MVRPSIDLRAVAAASAVAALVVPLAACSGSGDGPSAAPTVTVTETETVTASPSGTSERPSLSPSASPTRTANPTGTTCATDELRARVRELDSGAGQRNAVVVLTNVSQRSCDVTGYPGLQLVDSTGTTVPTKVVRVADPAPRTIAVAPGARVSSALNIGVVATGDEPSDGPCQPEATSVLVTPPDQTTSLTARWALGPVCSGGRIKANALVAGNGS